MTARISHDQTQQTTGADVANTVDIQAGSEPSASTTFTSAGPKPPVSNEWQTPGPSASDRAYGGAAGSKHGPRIGGESFGSAEHQTYGNDGARDAGYTGVFQPQETAQTSHFTLTHGDIVMLSGDYFDPRDKDESGKPVADNLFSLAHTPSSKPGQMPGTQDEVIYALYHANSKDPRFAKEGAFSRLTFSDAVKDSVNSRYLRLASANFEHFANPRGPNSGGPSSGNRHSAGGSYRALHEDALQRAHEAKKKGEPIDDAMAHEAAAEHFLTDGFAAGHLRTPRGSIEDFWRAKYPLFFENLKKTIAQDVAIYINANETNVVTLGGSVLEIMNGVLQGIDEKTKSMPPVGFEAIVATLTHDRDNAEGLWVKNDIGQTWKTYGDSHGGVINPKPGQEDTKLHVEEAVKLSIADVQHAYAAPATASDSDTVTQVKSQTLAPAHAGEAKYGAEQIMPFPDSAKAADNGKQMWQQPNFETLWTTPIRSDDPKSTFGKLIQDSVAHGDISEQLDGLAAKFDPVTNVKWAGDDHPRMSSDIHPQKAYKDSFLKDMKANPFKKIQQIINYDPGRGQSSVRESMATMQDLDRLQKQGMEDKDAGKPGAGPTSRMQGLTFQERIDYIHNLESFKGIHTNNLESWRIYDMFESAPPADRRRLYKALEGHEWDGSFRHGIFHINDDLWDSLDKTIINALEKLLNESP